MDDHPAMIDEAQLLAACQLHTTRRSGPGGQHRNKVETAVVLTHLPTGISAEANERRSQEANRREALQRLRLRLAVEHRTPAMPVSERWQARRRGQKIEVNADHADYPALLAEALNRLAAGEYEVPAAAEALGVSNTQLVNLLRKFRPAFAKLKDERQTRGLRPLR